MLTADVRSRVEPELKREAAAVLKASGLDLSTAIRLFLRSVVEQGGLPMEMPRPNADTLAAIREAKEGRATPVPLADF
ncbi:type II toxin-antitoxin system antitoxin, RelB/DinJ family [Melaminivora suipulveris]|uniref:Type II toxin-antitoxin system antitoxin, RelB/DinJ family n=1 Tax=Melaminivora suipulveris TaxID=2109913 RepID=A0A2R3QA51_9BURK|nr:type II toxin-antitoxin system RelB/DinJ family antitoxin [Melaminivora suipulveris]AVO48650.1 type II toxin-antitoxin system antitoxin, RelB/DinJ family [Melaminivora suipulveris]